MGEPRGRVDEIRHIRRMGIDGQRAQMGPTAFREALTSLKEALADKTVRDADGHVVHVPQTFEERLADKGLLPKDIRAAQVRVTAIFHGYLYEPERYERIIAKEERS